MFDSFYHLHIPKTGGRFIRYNVLDILAPYIEQKGIKIIYKDASITDLKYHGAWSPEITETTYILSSLRDPYSNLVSLFFHVTALDKEPQTFPNPPKYNPELVNKEVMFKAISERPYFFSNFQSKNLLYTEPYYNGKHSSSISAAENIKTLIERAKRINLLIRMEDMATLSPKSIAKKIIDDLELPVSLEQFIKDYESKRERLNTLNTLIKNDVVKELVVSLTQAEKAALFSLLSEDLFLYLGNRDLFYKFTEETA